MADLGWIGKEGVERMKFFIKSKETLEFLQEIRKHISSQKKLSILEETAQIITEIGNRLMEENRDILDRPKSC